MLLHEKYLEDIIQKVVERLRDEVPAAGQTACVSNSDTGNGLFASIDEAVAAARKAQLELAEMSLEKRKMIIAALRKAALDNLENLAQIAVDETGMGRFEDKIKKNRLVAEKTPGMEVLEPQAVSGDYGLTLIEPAPFGVIGAIIPSTNPTETVINNGIGMFAAGNTVVFNPHPGAKRTSQTAIKLFNKTVIEKFNSSL